ncbi:MAG: lytic murein transglycosylase [Alphaproteobacteria bacterium]|nr:lytic murein transglycosylase [Alphaproteobacteria bacterium]
MRKLLIFSLFTIHYSLFTAPSPAATGEFDFDRWNTILNQIQERAVAEKVDDRTINAAIQDAAFIPKIVWRDKNQAEFKLTLEEYLTKTVNATRIANGHKMRAKYPTLLNKVHQKYGVQPEVILAFWGMESNYGEYKAHYKLSDAFLTLIYEGRREQFFTDQLIALMKIASKNSMQIDGVKGSWAGAMGHFQFIPTTLQQYGADGNGDGRIDIINNISDAMYSAGNYLSKMGWNPHEKIVREVRLPENFDVSLCDGKTKKTLGHWAMMGISDVPSANMEAGLVCDAGANRAFLAYPNFYRVKKWNNSNSYAVAIALLSEQLAISN